ncbi:MAG: flagellar motor protein MotB [Candidatus Zixiibacteriota bacterium]
MSDEVQPIIIKKIKGGHGGHHGGAWKVAFADFMTAMMAFFLVMWLVGQKPEVRESVAGFFRDPGKFSQQGKSGVLKGSSGAIPSKGGVMSVVKNDDNQSGTGKSIHETKELTLAARRIVSEMEKQPVFKRLKDNIKVHITSEGLRIVLNESEDSPAFFEPGSAKPLQKSAVILMIIAKELGNLENKVVVEGHTDASFASNKTYSNWELSTDRANAARQLLEVSGLYDGQVQGVRGFADKFPMIIDKPNDARNRRITIVVLYKDRERHYDQMELGADLMSQSKGG